MRWSASKGLARIAGWIASLEYHFVAARLESVDPAHERGSAIEKRRLVQGTGKRDRQSDPSRVVEDAPAIIERTIDFRDSQQARLRDVFLLHVDQNDNRDIRCVGERPETND